MTKSHSAEYSNSETSYSWLKPAVIVAFVIIAIVAGFFIPIQDWAEAYKTWLEGLGSFGVILYVIIYALSTVLLVPGILLTLAGGLAYGLWAFPLVILGATTGSAIAFLTSRYLVRDFISEKFGSNDKFKAIDEAISESGWKVVGLLRLSPAVPFSLQNWMLGATSVKFIPYITATFFGIMPGALLYVWIGSFTGDLASTNDNASTLKYVFLAVGILATLGITYLIGKKASAKLKDQGIEK